MPPGRTRSRSSPTTRCRCSTRPAGSPRTSSAQPRRLRARSSCSPRPSASTGSCSAAPRPGDVDGYPLPEVTAKLIAEAPSLPPEVALRRFVENSMIARGEIAEQVYQGRLAHPPDPAGWAAQAAAGAAWDAGGRLRRRSTAPTLVITGTDDKVVDPRNSDAARGADPGRPARADRGRRAPLFWERRRGVSRSSWKVPGMTPHRRQSTGSCATARASRRAASRSIRRPRAGPTASSTPLRRARRRARARRAASRR